MSREAKKSKVSGKPSGVFSGLTWKFMERILAQGITFIVSIIVARLIMPAEYGIITLVLVFITIADVFVSNGFGLSLIQKKDSDELDFSTIFYCSLATGILLYLVIYLSAPSIARFYNMDLLCPVLRILGIRIVVSSFNTVQQAYVSKHLMFKKFFYSTVAGTLVSGVVGVVMAYLRFGVWALVAQYLANSVINTFVLFITIEWHPAVIFSLKRAKILVGYSWKLAVSGLINTLYTQLRSLIIGKIYSEADLAYYDKGNYFPQMIIINLNTAINDVLFPFLSIRNDDIIAVKGLIKKSMRMISYIVFPIIFGLMIISEPLVRVLLTDKWLDCVPYFRIMCLFWLMQPLQTANWQVLKALGRSDLCLKYELLKKGIGVLLLLLVMNVSVDAIAVSSVVLALISVIINMIPVSRIIKYSYKEQFFDVFPSLIMSVIMSAVVIPISFIKIPNILLIIIQLLLGVAAYLILSIITKNNEYLMIKTKLCHTLKKEPLRYLK